MSRICTHCGKPVSDKAMFCRHCGNKLDEIETDKSRKTAVYGAPIVDDSVERKEFRPRIEYNRPEMGPEDGPVIIENGPPKYMKIIIAVSVALIAVVLAIGAILYFSGTDDDIPDGDHGGGTLEPAEGSASSKGEGSGTSSGEHRYEVFNESMSWKDADSACKQKGGHLATITTADEYNEIVDLIESDGTKYHYWLGATDEDNEGDWEWITGESMIDGFTAWDSGKPNNSGETDPEKGEDYLEIKTTKPNNSSKGYMKWNDVCNKGVAYGYEAKPHYYAQEHYGYICEWDE